MTNEEKDIMRDAYYFLRDHSNPPPIGTDECAEFFLKAVNDLTQLISVTWKNHPLAMELGISLYSYLEKKCKAGSAEVTV